MKTAIAYDFKRNMVWRQVEPTTPQELANFFSNIDGLNGFPCEIVIVEQSPVSTNGGTGGGIIHSYAAPTITARYIRGRDFSEHVESLESVCETIKTWIDNLDEAEAIGDLLQKVTGAEDVRIIKEGQATFIAYDTPYKE